MVKATKTLKIPFLSLNQIKQNLFASFQQINTAVANEILALPKDERSSLTSKHFRDVSIGSAWINQTIRNANARTKVKQFRCLPLETNNQNWTLHRVGETYSLSFGLERGKRRRVPLEIHQASHADWLDALLAGVAEPGSMKLWRSSKGIWSACISVTREVPEAAETDQWIGIDRGQNIPAVAGLPGGRGIFYKANEIRHLRKQFALRRKKLQKAGKHRAVKKLESRERRIVTHINHCLSKAIVGDARRLGLGIRLEDLSDIRKGMRQRKKTKSDASKNHDYWPFYQLETFIVYKATLGAVSVDEKKPPQYTSQMHWRCGHIGKRKGVHFYCANCDKHEHSDLNAGHNLRQWDGTFCAVEPRSQAGDVMSSVAPSYGRYGNALNCVNDGKPNGLPN
ncbi:MAG: RNA-guided endonuclease TnpB family protein [Gammaproteobacteria bacterium]